MNPISMIDERQLIIALLVVNTIFCGALLIMALSALVVFLKRRAMPDQPSPDRPETLGINVDTSTVPPHKPLEAEASTTKPDNERITKEEISDAIKTDLAPLKELLRDIAAHLAAIDVNVGGPDIESDASKRTREIAQEARIVLGDILAVMTNVSSEVRRLSIQLTSLPAMFEAERVRHIEVGKQKRETARQQLQEEKQKKEQEELENRRALLRNELVDRFEGITRHSALFDIASLTRSITDELQKVCTNSEFIENSLPQYLQLISKVDETKSKFEEFKRRGEGREQVAPADLDDEAKSLEKSLEDLTDVYKPGWFISLLDEASGYSSLQHETDSLKDVLGLEDICVEPGTVPKPKDLEGLDVLTIIGNGDRTVIADMIERGYRVKGGGIVIKKPKVIVRLEN